MTAARLGGQPVPEWERIVAEARDLDDLLDRPDLLAAYFVALRKAYLPRLFAEESFNVILAQLRQIKERVPALKARLWETTGMGKPFSVPLGLKTYGRAVDTVRWDRYVGMWLDALHKMASPWYAMRPADREPALRAFLASLEARIKSFGGAGRGESRAHVPLKVEFFKSLRASPDIRAASAFVLHRALTERSAQDCLFGDTDLILNTMNRLQHSPARWLGSETPGIHLLSPFLKDRVPPFHALLRDDKLFPFETRVSHRGKESLTGGARSVEFRFQPLPRRLHGIWKGAPLGDCVGGDLRWGVESTTPERWATVALPGTQLHHVERVVDSESESGSERSEFVGFVQAVPMRDRLTGEIVASLDLMCPVIFRKALVGDAGGPSTVMSVFDLCLKELVRQKPDEWKGYAVSDSEALNHDGVLSQLRRSPQFLFGSKRPAKRFEHLDGLAGEIVRNSVRRGQGRVYGGNMIFDGSVADARNLTVLDPDVVNVAHPGGDTGALTGLLVQGDETTSWWAALALLRRSSEDLAALRLVLTRLELAVRRGLRHVYEGPVTWARARYARVRNTPPPTFPTSELWVESVEEISRWLARRPDLVRVAGGASADRYVAASDEAYPCVSLGLSLLRRLFRNGRTPAVRAAAAKALGALKLKSPRDVRMLSRAARPPLTYRRRIATRRVRNASLEALGELHWDHPRVTRVLRRVLSGRHDEEVATQLTALEALRKIKPHDPRIVSRVAELIQGVHAEPRALAASVARELGYFDAETIESLQAVGQLRDPQSHSGAKLRAITTLLRNPRKDVGAVAVLSEVLSTEADSEVRSAAILALCELGVPTAWTIIATAAQPAASRRRFVRAVRERGVSPSALARAAYGATQLEPSTAVATLIEELSNEVARGKPPFLSRLGDGARALRERKFVFQCLAALTLIVTATIGWGISFGRYLRFDADKRVSRAVLFELKGLEDWLDVAAGRQPTTVANVPPSARLETVRKLSNDPEELERLDELAAIIRELEHAGPPSRRAAAEGRRQDNLERGDHIVTRLEWRRYERLASNQNEERNAMIQYTAWYVLGTVVSGLVALLAIWLANRNGRRLLQAESVLRQRDERHRLFVTGMKNHAFFLLGEDGQVTTWNEAAERLLGYRADEITGQPFSAFYSKRGLTRGQPAHDLKVCRTEGCHEFEAMLARKDGTFFRAEVTLSATGRATERGRPIVAVVHLLDETRGVRRGRTPRPRAAA